MTPERRSNGLRAALARFWRERGGLSVETGTGSLLRELLSGGALHISTASDQHGGSDAEGIELRQARLIRRHSTIGIILAMATAFLTTVAFVFVVPVELAITWGGAMVAYLAYKSVLGWPRAMERYIDTQSPSFEGLHRWYATFIFIHTVLWGIAGAIFFVPNSIPFQLLLVSMVLSVCCGFVWSLSASRINFIYVAVPMLTPLTARLLMEGGFLPYVAAATLIVAIPATVFASRKAQAAVRAGLARDAAHHVVVDELTRTSAALHAALAQVHGGFCVIAPDGTLDFFNERLAGEIDLPHSMRKPGTKIADILLFLADRGEFGDTDRDRVREWVETTWPAQMGRTARHQHVRPDGTVIQISAQPMPEGGQVVALTDVTETLRTAETRERAHRMESLGNLAGGIAHSLNNILVPILTLSGRLARETPEDSKNHERLNIIFQSADRARNLVSRILAFSRSGEHAFELMDIYTLISETIELLRETLPTSVAIRLDLDPHTGKVMADPTQTEMLVMNLVSNAVDAMAGRTGVMEISLAPVDLDDADVRDMAGMVAGAYAKLTVRDQGRGIPEDVIDHIFEPFFTTKPVGEGTGLGLSVAYGIVNAHHGGIRVASKPDAGTTIEVFLPLDGNSEAKPAPA